MLIEKDIVRVGPFCLICSFLFVLVMFGGMCCNGANTDEKKVDLYESKTVKRTFSRLGCWISA